MISSIFLKIFWGTLITMLDIRIIIDLLIDPIGYYMIYSGVKQLVKDFPIGNKAKLVSFVLIFYSLPSIIIDNNQVLSLGWDWYFTIFTFIDLILVFYLFQLIIEIAKAADDSSFVKRTFRTGTVYFINIFIAHLVFSFIPNFPIHNFVYFISITILLSTLVLEIMFLVLLMAVRKLDIELSG